MADAWNTPDVRHVHPFVLQSSARTDRDERDTLREAGAPSEASDRALVTRPDSADHVSLGARGLSRFARVAHGAVFFESRAGRAGEIAVWSNAAASLALGAGAFVRTGSWKVAIVASVVTFALLRLALIHRLTVWFAAALGTMSVGAFGGAIAWLFAHVVEAPAVPVIAAASGALLAAAPAAWGYAKLARRRADDVPDSLIAPSPASR